MNVDAYVSGRESTMDDEARAILDGYRTSRSPTQAEVACAWEKVQTRLAAGDQGTPLPGDRSWRRAGLFGFGAGALSASIAFASWLAFSSESVEAAHHRPKLDLHEFPDALSAPRVVIPIFHDHAASEPADPLPRRSASVPRDAGPVLESEHAPAGTLAEEMALLQPARRAGRDGDLDRAMELLEHHADRFPGGQLADERELERARVLCAQGHTSEARAIARDLVEARPGTPLASKATRACP
jgi:hypothetical protein